MPTFTVLVRSRRTLRLHLTEGVAPACRADETRERMADRIIEDARLSDCSLVIVLDERDQLVQHWAEQSGG